MIIQLENKISERERENILARIKEISYKANEVTTQYGNYIVAIGKNNFDIRSIGHLAGVRDVHRVSDDYKLVSNKWKVNRTVIDLGDNIFIGEDNFAIMAGPCSIESLSQIESIVNHLVENNIHILRGGAFKPRSSPYSFRGLGIDGLKMLYEKCKKHRIKIISEVMEISQIEPMHDYVDIYQVGARNTQNFNLLHELGKIKKPVLIKRGLSGTIEELLHSAEYVFSSGNEQLILCERGIRTFENAYRNTLDINAIPVLKEKTHLPVIVDPSHGIGIRKHINSIALAAVMAGADGLLIEVHPTPEEAFSDGQQTLNYQESAQLFNQVRQAVALKNKLVL